MSSFPRSDPLTGWVLIALLSAALIVLKWSFWPAEAPPPDSPPAASPIAAVDRTDLLGAVASAGEADADVAQAEPVCMLAGQTQPTPEPVPDSAPAATATKPAAASRPVPAVRRGPLPRLAQPRVLIEKAARRLTVFDGDRAVKAYRVAIGRRAGDKVREGDLRTPEGDFYVCVRNPQSQYVLSLGLSYPNVEDAERGLRGGLIGRRQHAAIVRAIRRGTRPPWNTALGGEIMIHGDSGADATHGCIAVRNDAEIRELYAALPIGTPVTITP